MRGLRSLFATAVAAAVVFAFPALASAGDLTLEVSGDCPGQLTLRWSGAEPNRPMAIAYADTRGFYVIAGRCEGTELGLSSIGLRLIVVISSRSGGSGRVAGRAGTPECGGWLQLVVASGHGAPCVTSNVVQIPE